MMVLTMCSKESETETKNVKKQTLRTNRAKDLRGIWIERRAF